MPSPIKSNKPPQIALSTAGGQLIQIRMPSTPGSSSSSPAILGRSPQIQIAPPSSATSVPSAVSAATPPKIQLPSVPLPQSSVSVGPALSAKNAVPTVTMANGGDVGPKIRYKCPFCPFSSDSQAPVHSHLKAKKYRCSGCGFLTCSKEAITQHQMDKHGKTHIQLEQQERQDRQEQQQQQQAKRPAAGAGAGPAAVASMSDGGPAAKKRNTGRSPSGAHGPPPPILSSPPPLPSGLKVGGSSGMAMIQLPTTPVPPPQLMDATATADLPGLGGIKLPQHPTPPNPPLPPPPLPQTPRQITTYTCAICRSYNATTEAAVEEHARLAHNIQQHQLNLGSTGKRYLCQFCDFVSTTSKEEVVNHILSAHPHGSQGPATTYACPHCTYKSTVASEIERHVRESHTLNPAPVAPPPPAIPPEMETTRYACAYCNFVSDSVPAVQAHSLEVHNVALAGADEATEMLQTTTTTQPPQPPPLPQIPVDPATVAGAAAPAPLPMICPHCGAGFEESSLFKAHLDSHGSKR